ncbi:hypothetical protein GCM10023258_23230 [Terrabacter aeriphilus]|uniref:Uncharacterized protein n=1 Tax=Terrabacter aeriphilus TaxID=515662 RepID=A0ABP9JCT1_9MICO
MRLMNAAGVPLEVGRAAYGISGMVAPAWLAGHELHGVPDDTTVGVARMLGVRHLAQAVAVVAAGVPEAHRAGALVDGLHAMSMVAWAAATGRDRRYFVTSAVLATSLAVLEWRAGLRGTGWASRSRGHAAARRPS